MLLHDACDVFMEGAKLAKYAKQDGASVGLFACFTVAWVLLRLVCFPLFVIRSSLWEAPRLTGVDPAVLQGLNGLLLVLLLLHCYWFSLILRVVWITLTTGSATDVRESDDSDDES